MTIDPVSDVTDPFNARYTGTCQLPTCEKRRRGDDHGTIEQGDVVQYVLGALVHMVCARRIVRNQVAPLCKTCWLYHAGECA